MNTHTDGRADASTHGDERKYENGSLHLGRKTAVYEIMERVSPPVARRDRATQFGVHSSLGSGRFSEVYA